MRTKENSRTAQSSPHLWGVCLINSGCHNKLPQFGSLNNKKFISPSSRDWEVWDQAPAWWGSDESSLPGLQLAAILLCPHLADSVSENKLSNVSSYEGTNPMRGLHPRHLITSQKPILNTITLAIRASIYEFGEHTKIQSTKTSLEWIKNTVPTISISTYNSYVNNETEMGLSPAKIMALCEIF